jgi:DNA repair exonuclease SbcCD nuclease subunit
MRILCAADIHLGRQPSMSAFPGQTLTFRSAWDFVVDAAIRERADLLVLAGDLVERDNRYFEAWAPLKAGVERLLRAGVTIAAIAGNHDSEVLPRLHADLARELEPAEAGRFLLLGSRDGKLGVWTQEVVRFGADALRLVGWSFPAHQHSADPFHGWAAVPGDLPTLGLLHGDLEVARSPYAPFTAAALRAAGLDRWVLGHIHAPSARGAAPFYCGSPIPLRASETGAHGCWLLTLEGRTWSNPVLVPADLRIETLEVPLTRVEASEADVQATILHGMRWAVRACQERNPGLKGLLFRVQLTGESAVPAPRATDAFALLLDEVHVAIHGEVENLTRPPSSLDEWSADKGARGILARLIRDLDRGVAPPEDWSDLLEQITRLEQESRSAGAFASLDTRWKDETTAAPDWPRALLRRTCVRLFNAMIQREGDHARA